MGVLLTPTDVPPTSSVSVWGVSNCDEHDDGDGGSTGGGDGGRNKSVSPVFMYVVRPLRRRRETAPPFR